MMHAPYTQYTDANLYMLKNYIDFFCRSYPPAFGRRLLELHDEVQGRPRLDLRQKLSLNPLMTDLQIFRGLSEDDCWVDAQLPSLFIYCYNAALQKGCIPDSWDETMRSLHQSMQKYAAKLF